eukprot:10031956-Heterocapsa_arctica.AAC.1
MFAQRRLMHVDVVQQRALGSCPLEPIHPDLARVILQLLVVHLDVALVVVKTSHSAQSWLDPSARYAMLVAMPFVSYR